MPFHSSAYKRVGILLSIALLSRPATAQPVSDTAKESMRALGPSSRLKQSEHFDIAYDTPYDTLRKLMGRIEGTYGAVQRFAEGVGLPDTPHDRLNVVLFKSYDDFAGYAKRAGIQGGGLAGFYRPSTNVSTFFDTAAHPSIVELDFQIDTARAQFAKLRQQGAAARDRQQAMQATISSWIAQRTGFIERINKMVIQHEAAHQVAFNLGLHVRGAQNPVWFVEGLACQFEVAQPNQNGRLTSINHLRLADLRDALALPAQAQSAEPEALDRAIRAGKLWRIADLVSSTQVPAASAEQQSMFYAQSWALVAFLHRSRPDQFAEYVRDAAKRKPGAPISSAEELAAFERAFGSAGPDLDTQFFDNTLKLRLNLSRAGR